MSESEPQRTRVRVEDPTPEPDPARTGCLWVGGILGVIVGVVVTFFAVPSILNFLFPSETIEVGETFEDDKLTMRVAATEVRTSITTPPHEVLVVQLEVEAESSWSVHNENFVLVLDSGEELRAYEMAAFEGGADQTENGARVHQGSTVLWIAFSGETTSIREPDSLHLEEPPVKFELPEPVVAWQ